MTDEIRKLLGGYATGTLSEDERIALFEAALHDQELFEALEDEQALFELLEDGSARAQLLQATETTQFSLSAAFREWFSRPKAKALAGVGFVLLLTIGIKETLERKQEPAASLEVAEARKPAATVPAQPPPPARSVQQTPARRRKRVSDSSGAAAAPVIEKPREEAAAKQADAIAVTAAAPPVPAVAGSAYAEPQAAFVRAQPAALQNAVAGNPATRIARSGDLELKYTVLLRNEKGEFLPIAAEYAFASSDRARLHVEANHAGVLKVTGGDDRKPVYVHNVEAGAPFVVPAELGPGELDITFTPTSTPGPTAGFVAQDAAPRAKSSARAAVASEAAREQSSIHVRLNLRRKN